MVAVAVDAGWGEDAGQAVQKLESREAEAGAAAGVRFRQEIEDLVGAVVDEVKAFEGKRPSGTITNQAFESFPVGGLDTDAGVEAEPTTVIPCEHVLGFVGLQEAVTDHVAEDPFSHRVL
jgi:hypothetical protein